MAEAIKKINKSITIIIDSKSPPQTTTSTIIALCRCRRSVSFSLTAISRACRAFTARTELLDSRTCLVHSMMFPRPSSSSLRDVMASFRRSTGAGRDRSSDGAHTALTRPNGDHVDRLSAESFRSSASCDNVEPIIIILSSSHGLHGVTEFVNRRVVKNRGVYNFVAVKNLFLIEIAIVLIFFTALPTPSSRKRQSLPWLR